MKPTVYVTRNDYARIGLDLLKEEWEIYLKVKSLNKNKSNFYCDRCELTIWDEPSPVPRDEFMRNVAGKDAIFCSLNDRIDKELLDQAGPSLKVVSTISVG